jgi:hypothetical protein
MLDTGRLSLLMTVGSMEQHEPALTEVDLNQTKLLENVFS